MTRGIRPVVLAAGLAASVVSGLTRGPVGAAAAQTKFRSSIETVAVYATVHGPDGVYLPGLTVDDFELTDNGKRQNITVFSSDIQPTTIAILLDRSGSLAHEAAAVADAAHTFANDLLPEDRASVGTLLWDCQAMTADKAALQATLQGPMQSDLGSPIWSALDRVMWSLDRDVGRRAVLLFSDGMDTGSVTVPKSILSKQDDAGRCRQADTDADATLDEASDHAAREGLLLYTISVDAPGGTNDSALKRLAGRTGGSAYKLTRESDLTPAFTSIVDELHHQYLLGFVPAAFDGKVHDLAIRVTRPGATVRARKNYFAAHDSTAAENAGLRARPDAAPPAAPTRSDMDAAIKKGAAGGRLQATCTASAAFYSASEATASARVVAEGPIGRIMRAAREAKAQHRPFSSDDITDRMASKDLSVTVELTPAPASVSGAQGREAAPADRVLVDPPTSIRLRDKSAFRPRLLSPIGYERPGPAGPLTLTAIFDMAEFNTLIGPTIEAVITSGVGERRCGLSAGDLLAIR